MARTSETAKNAWNARNYDQILISVRKGEKEKLKEAAAAAGVGSVSRFIIECINAVHPDLLTVLDDESKKRGNHKE